MGNRIRPTRSGLFAIELLIAVGVFIFCAAICLGLFVKAETISADSVDLNRAVNEARSAAECYKAVGGDLEKTAALVGGSVSGDKLTVVYDSDWNVLQGAVQVSYTLELDSKSSKVSVTSGSEELLNWPVAVLEVAG